MLSFPQRRTTALCTAAAGLLALFSIRWAVRPLPPLSLPSAPVDFNGATAVGFTRVVAEEYPDRVTGSPGAEKAAEFLRAQLQEMGYAVTTPEFSMWLRGQQVRGKNVVALLEGNSPEHVAVIAHYDRQFTSHQAAEDNASGVGVLLELASVLRSGPHPRGLIFAATDAEEWGMIGARELAPFLKQHPTVAVISIDHLNAGPAASLELDCMGQFEGYAPLWLRRLVVAAARAQGVKVQQATGAHEWIERALEVSSQDQGPLLRAGIPAINLGTTSTDPLSARAPYPSAEDIFRGFDAATFQMIGSTVERTVLALEAPSFPGGTGPASFAHAAKSTGLQRWGPGDFQIRPDAYVPGWLLYAIQVLFLLPILMAAFYAARNSATEDLDLRGWRFIEPVSWIIPPGLATLLLYGLTEVNALPRYELYLATPKDPFLDHPHYALLAGLAALIVAGSVGLQSLRARVDAPPAPFEIKKRILFLWVTIVTMAAFLNDPYAAWLFLGGFAYVALILISPSSLLARALNAALLILAAAPFAALMYFYNREIYLGWHMGWYLVLQAAYRVWSPLALALFFLAVVLAVRLFWISVWENTSEQV